MGTDAARPARFPPPASRACGGSRFRSRSARSSATTVDFIAVDSLTSEDPECDAAIKALKKAKKKLKKVDTPAAKAKAKKAKKTKKKACGV